MPKVIDDKVVYRAAIELLVAFGYTSTTTQQIADAAGIHEATLFRKYGSKANLVEQAVQSEFSDVPFAKLGYTGNLEADLRSIVEAYLETSEMVGDILPILLIEIPRNPELQKSLVTPWENIQRVSHILERYQSQGKLKPEPVLNSISALLGPLMVQHLLKRPEINLPIPEVEPRDYVDLFLHGRLV
ncbi:MAG: TetR/AcrR family transcriptional regulator [Anaerolineales bacterium]|jgi:AcrR family transcriptional regulator